MNDICRNTHEHWMRLALEQAKLAREIDEVPIGAVLVDSASNELIAAAYNRPVSENDPTAHAELVVLRQASQSRNNYRLPGTTLYVTIEPCTMCVGALMHARISAVVFGAREPRAGAIVSQQELTKANYFNHRLSFEEGILADECGSIMQEFFQSKRTKNE
ncbi:MAG: tRNA adenosine(34) deaminase TadA [Gammaproteobacteria bacterium]|nr:tRNA adenosine(34) deaminase TadA [Gammaproteobacteria bacterium]MDD9895262.1 tRNA adenosine(34) deaminase TadA [Gammaproteobacteria bacterium]MDD9959274.1 tRNA adenosine(34) deaminase TadA [Gammaproteobacteria bacterium]